MNLRKNLTSTFLFFMLFPVVIKYSKVEANPSNTCNKTTVNHIHTILKSGENSINHEEQGFTVVIQKFKQGLEIYQNHNCKYPLFKSALYFGLAHAYLKSNEYEEAEKYSQQFLQTIKTKDQPFQFMETYNVLGKVYNATCDYDNAVIYHNQQLELAQKYEGYLSFHPANNTNSNKFRIYKNIAHALINLGVTNLDQDDLITAEKQFIQAEQYIFHFINILFSLNKLFFRSN
ncbi:MAG: tetratricopeptide repeat protein, partial [Sphaerospermopsis sp. SIO1G2]|nr:tetratricopeptide repeat protein [Sphaerospermopsis sp. SIO1G2]